MLDKTTVITLGLCVAIPTAMVGCGEPEQPVYSTFGPTSGATTGAGTTGGATLTSGAGTTGGLGVTTGGGSTGGVTAGTVAGTTGFTTTSSATTGVDTTGFSVTSAGTTATGTTATGTTATGTTATGTTATGTTGSSTTGGTSTCSAAITPNGADSKFSFFVTSYKQLVDLSGSNSGFGGDLRYNGAATGLQGADAICQEMACRVGFGNRTWKAFLSTSTEDAKDRIGAGPWYDFAGSLVANDVASLLSSGNRQPGGCCNNGTYDELGLLHNGSTDQNNDGVDDDDHDTMTATNDDGTYAGFSCEDWTSTTLTAPSGGMGGFGGGGGIMMGHSWPAQSGMSWVTSHAGHSCAAGTNFIQDGPGDSSTVGGGGGYGGFYCFALPQ